MRIPEGVKAAVTVALLWMFVSLAWTAHGASIFSTKYDDQIQQATRKWWPDYPQWQFWKSQLFAESRLNPNARSSVGAEGLAQFVEPTWKEITRAMSLGAVSRTDAQASIEAGAFYMARLRHSWSAAPRPIDDAHRLAEASYNGGIGNMLKAQHACRNALLWVNISPCLPSVTGADNAFQTQTYVARIAQYRALMGR